MKISKIANVIAICFCLAVVNQFAHSQVAKKPTGFETNAAKAKPTVHIGGWALTVNNKIVKDFDYKGTCPVALQFSWSILSTAPTEAAYHFTFSDNSQPTASTKVNIPKADTAVDVSKTWTLGINNSPEFKDYKGWMKLAVSSPDHVEQKIDFTVRCK
jgi:hypothetical protein